MFAFRAVVALLLLGAIATAHHSTAPYDLVHGTIITGEVKRFEWENPHTRAAAGLLPAGVLSHND